MASKKFSWPKVQYDLVLVCWDDAAGLKHGWTAKEEALEPYLAVSAGFLIRENDQYIMIAQDTDEEGSHNGRTQIPRGMVRHIKVLRKSDKRGTNENLSVQRSKVSGRNNGDISPQKVDRESPAQVSGISNSVVE